MKRNAPSSRLESTEENLRQVDALLIELTPHLKNLRRQAEKMNAAKEVAVTLKKKQELLYGLLVANVSELNEGIWLREKDAHERELFDLEIAAKKGEGEIQSLSEKMNASDEEDALQKRIQELQMKVNESAQSMALTSGKNYFGARKAKNRRGSTNDSG